MKIYVIAGEASGDLHGARLIDALQSLSAKPLEIYGVGGDRIKETGALRFYDLAHFHVTGITQAIKKIPQYRRAARQILSDIVSVRPGIVVLIDNPGFNLYLAEKIHAMNIPIVYYISPQIWAWKKNRVFKIKKTVSKMLVVFEFEKKIYEEHGVPVEFVGHPLKDLLSKAPLKDCRRPLISLMPGSRKHEVETLLPILLKSAKMIHEKHPEYSFQLIEAPTLSGAFYDRLIHPAGTGQKITLPFERIRKNSYESIRRSRLVLVCSGTATLECALLETPMIIVNRASFITYLVAKAVLRVPYLGLPNLILNRPAMPELMQYQATPEKIAAKALEILENDSLTHQMQNDLKEIGLRLGPGIAANNAAREILDLSLHR